MLPWFIYLLMLLGYLQSPEEWDTLTPTQQQNYIIIIDTSPH